MSPKPQPVQETAPEQQGTVIRLLLGQGFGFLKADDGIERFFHAKENDEFFNLTITSKVSFTPVEHPKGPRAVGIRKIDNGQ